MNAELPATGEGHAETASLWAALTEVMDPEVPVSLVDLGLIYGVRVDDGDVEVDISFTATACPAMGFIQDDIRARLLAEPGVDRVTTRIVWEPPWTPDRISETGREQLKGFGISL
ncbi:MAG: metal-sulfur cluster assembly factor [Acidobacteriota bacterium]|jgi:metal-sulfur cluster biosynthetic enzyme